MVLDFNGGILVQLGPFPGALPSNLLVLLKPNGISIGKVLNSKGGVTYRFVKTSLFIVRFADDFVVLARSRKMIEDTIKPCVKNFLAARGLSLSEDKTIILSGRQTQFFGLYFPTL